VVRNAFLLGFQRGSRASNVSMTWVGIDNSGNVKEGGDGGGSLYKSKSDSLR